MTREQHILDTARARGQDQQLPYAGAVTPEEAYALLQLDANVKLIDVRTDAERAWVGKVALPDPQHGNVEWSTWPAGAANADFMQQLVSQAKPDQILLFLCRSGVRSRHAAKLATEHGFHHCFDILHGFEGDKNEHGHRKSVAGWCHAGLPWHGA